MKSAHLRLNVFTCCAFFPLSLFFVLGPMLAAGRGVRAFLVAIGLELLLAVLVLLMNLPATMDGLENWRTHGLLILPFVGMLLVPMGMGAVILYAQYAEAIHPGKHCRVCGYDLRATPLRCPECGTPVKSDPEEF